MEPTNYPNLIHWKALREFAAFLYQNRHTTLTAHGPRSKFWEDQDIFRANQAVAFCDANYGNELDTQSTICGQVYVNFLCVSYFTRHIKITCSSTAEAEAAAIYEVAKALISVRSFLDEIGFKQKCSTIYTDNRAAELICNASHPSRKQRCWRVRACFIQELTDTGVINIQHMPGEYIPADTGTKHAIPDFPAKARRVSSMDRLVPEQKGG